MANRDKPGLLDALPPTVAQMKECGLRQGTVKSKNKYVSSFIHRLLPSSSYRKGAEDELRHKAFVFDNVRKKKTGPIHKKKNTLSAKEKRKLFYDSKLGDFRAYQSLAALWHGYIAELIDFTKIKKSNPEEIERKILKADLHGSTLHVTKSKCPSLVGCKGIVVQETKSTFKVITSNEKIKVLPKRNTDFTLHIKDWACTIHGNNFTFRPADRANRNFKSVTSLDIN